MKRALFISNLLYALALATSARAQFVDQIGTTDPYGNTGAGTSVLDQLTAGFESANCSTTSLACINNTAVGFQALFSNTTGFANTSTGYNALFSNATGSYNTAAGLNALYGNTVSSNTGFGYGASYANKTGSFNTAVGSSSLYNATGGSNTAVGSYALYGSVGGTASGSDNAAVGANALQSFTTGSYNAAVGQAAMSSTTSGENNTALGYEALYKNTTGYSNAAQGAGTLRANTTGYHNTGIGNGALSANTAGNDNTALGWNAGSQVFDSNNIDIGNTGTGSDSGVIRIGTQGTHTTAYVQGIFDTGGLGGALPVVVTASGQLGVGGASSERLKNDVTTMGAGSERLQRLRPVTFHYKNDPHGALQYGLIAEEVAEIYPELVTRDASGHIYGLRYDELAPMLLNEVQQQRRQMRQLKLHDFAQEQKIARLQQQLQEMHADLAQALGKHRPVAQQP